MRKFAVILAVAIIVLIGCGSQPSPGSSGWPPAIPHQVSQNMDCKQCHLTGKNGAKITKHAGRPNCTKCHRVKQ